VGAPDDALEASRPALAGATVGQWLGTRPESQTDGPAAGRPRG